MPGRGASGSCSTVEVCRSESGRWRPACWRPRGRSSPEDRSPRGTPCPVPPHVPSALTSASLSAHRPRAPPPARCPPLLAGTLLVGGGPATAAPAPAGPAADSGRWLAGQLENNRIRNVVVRLRRLGPDHRHVLGDGRRRDPSGEGRPGDRRGQQPRAGLRELRGGLLRRLGREAAAGTPGRRPAAHRRGPADQPAGPAGEPDRAERPGEGHRRHDFSSVLSQSLADPRAGPHRRSGAAGRRRLPGPSAVRAGVVPRAARPALRDRPGRAVRRLDGVRGPGPAGGEAVRCATSPRPPCPAWTTGWCPPSAATARTAAAAATTLVNTNSTGLAAQALAAFRHFGSASAAGDWVGALQLTEERAGGGPAADDLGALAYDRPTLREALDQGITDTTRDVWRRSTPQAQFALRPVPFMALAAG